MSAIGAPSATPKGGLPFKRTTKRKSVQTPGANSSQARKEPDAIDLFRHSDHFLEEREKRQRQAVQKAAKRDKKRRESLPKDDENEGVEAQLVQESRESNPISNKKRRDPDQVAIKRQRISLSDEDDEDDKDKRPSSQTPSVRKSSRLSTTPRSKTTTPAKRPAQGFTNAMNVISIDDSDDEEYRPPPSAKGKEKMRNEMIAEDDQAISDNPDFDSEQVLDTDEDTAKFIKDTMENIKQTKASRLARETNPDSAELLIDSRLEGIPPLKIKVHTNKKMEFVKEAWVLKNMQRSIQIPKPVIENMFFTWKRKKIYNHTTLESLNITPDGDGNLYPSWEDAKEGFKDRNRVHIEAWTYELFEEDEKALDRQRRRNRGEFDEELEIEPEPEPEPAKDARIKVILRSKDHGEQNLKVPPNCEVKHLIKAFRTSKKIPEDKDIEMHFDGQMLDVDSTIDNYEIEDMEKVDVYVK